MLEVLILFALFSFKHFVIDFPLQTKFQYSNKGIYGHPGGILHSILHGLGTFLCLFYFSPAILLTIICGLLDAIIHYHIDWAKVKLNSYYNLGPNTHESFWWLLGLDQFLHYLTYIALIGYVVGVF